VTEQESLRHEIYLLGQIIKADALALVSTTMNDHERELLHRQITSRTAHQEALRRQLDRLLGLVDRLSGLAEDEPVAADLA
jgi:hypothetical protein